ncbi:hypothetical protein GYH30_018843 [Glycine max]|nr:hypothetical protein GYH30_018843 [Glycine max]
MAPTAAMLMLSHNGKTHAPSSSSSSATTYYSSLKASAFKWVAKYNPVPKARSENKSYGLMEIYYKSLSQSASCYIIKDEVRESGRN